MKTLLSALLSFLPARTLPPATRWQESPLLAQLFRKSNTQGTFVLYDVSADTYTGLDQARASTRFSPAATFLIPSQLIGLTAGNTVGPSLAMPAENNLQPSVPMCEQNGGLQRALILSDIQTQGALPHLHAHLLKLEYGNHDVGSKHPHAFWESGPLAISALEQTRFLSRLAQGKLPYPTKAQRQTQDLFWLEQGGDWRLYGTTGWLTDREHPLGWWVGWVEKQGRIYGFALNGDMTEKEDTEACIALGKSCLRALGIL
ncbi:penicillin-binding transpeptidase domain-containing protein [Pseudomonas duriflava]|nr:penicillin-binding transpeptidase domain-containing protein [Pseudomonas duriflava]